MQQKYGLTPAVRIDNPQAFVNQNHYKAGNLDIFFFANYSLTEAYTLDTEFNIDLRGRRMWLWDPMTGERALLPDTGTRLKLHLEPNELLLGPRQTGQGRCDRHGRRTARRSRRTSGPALERHAQPLRRHRRRTRNRPPVRPGQGEAFRILLRPDRLPHDLSSTSVPANARTWNWRGNCVSELYVNGVKAGTVWHGRHVYDVAKLLRPGKNELKLVLTTTLGNDMLSLKKDPHDGQVEQLQIQAGSQSLRSDGGDLTATTLPSRSSSSCSPHRNGLVPCGQEAPTVVFPTDLPLRSADIQQPNAERTAPQRVCRSVRHFMERCLGEFPN
ncbi:MAG: hypothetical protein V8Q38_05210 [Alistipes putredinis]